MNRTSSFSENFHKLKRYSFILCWILLCGQSVLQFDWPLLLKAPALVIITLAGVVIINLLSKRAATACNQWSEQQSDHLDQLSLNKTKLFLLLATAVGLFLQLAIIKWHSSVFPVLALFKNISLLSCFCGLGIGYALAKSKNIPLISVPVLLLLQVIFFTALDYLDTHHFEQATLSSLYYNPVQERMAMGLSMHQVHSVASTIVFYVYLAATILPTILIFIPLGQTSGRLMSALPPLQAYGINLLGSCLGILLMLVAGYFWLSPTLWFLATLCTLLWFIPFKKTQWSGIIIMALLIVSICEWPLSPEKKKIYSPYQLLEIGPPTFDMDSILSIDAAGYYHQKIFDLSAENLNRDHKESLIKIAGYYELPYLIAKKSAPKVLIVGSGTGNDVAAALRFGASHIDAVEIDPAILHLGKSYHPEKPYNDPNVHIFIQDARTFFSQAELNSYDLIVFGLLDSHTLLSHASSVRLDSFVYTLESLQHCRTLLKSDGVMSLSFSVMNLTLGKKINQTIAQAFDGKVPTTIQSEYDGQSMIYLQNKQGTLMVSNDAIAPMSFKNVSSIFNHPDLPAIDVSTDDWPFLYMPQKIIPKSYLYTLGFLLAVFALCIFSFKTTTFQWNHSPFFFMGAGFMLVETKAITELGLQFGNTWNVIGIVIIAILLMAYLANQMVARFQPKALWPYFIGIGLTLLLGLYVSHQTNSTHNFLTKLAITLLLISPVFFSGIIFSRLLHKNTNIPAVMAANIAGAMVGGVLEYNSMGYGFSFLYWLALGIYGVAWFTAKRFH